jgi:Fibronectin type III domain
MICKIIFQMLITLKTQLSVRLSLHSLFFRFFSLTLTLLISSMFVPLSHSAEITLAWDHNDQVSISGYFVYYGLESGNYSVKIDVGFEPQYTLVGLSDTTSYYIAVTAYNEFGESDFSEEIMFSAYACDTDIDFDGDIDGSDLVLYAEDSMAIDLAAFGAKFGMTNCPF